MPAKIYYDKDADLSLLKDKTLAILGYGSQGHAHAQNLRDSGCSVVVAELPGTPNYDQAVKDGFQPLSTEEATEKGDVITILLPDELQADIFRAQIRDHLSPGNGRALTEPGKSIQCCTQRESSLFQVRLGTMEE